MGFCKGNKPPARAGGWFLLQKPKETNLRALETASPSDWTPFPRARGWFPLQKPKETNLRNQLPKPTSHRNQLPKPRGRPSSIFCSFQNHEKTKGQTPGYLQLFSKTKGGGAANCLSDEFETPPTPHPRPWLVWPSFSC